MYCIDAHTQTRTHIGTVLIVKYENIHMVVGLEFDCYAALPKHVQQLSRPSRHAVECSTMCLNPTGGTKLSRDQPQQIPLVGLYL